MDIWKQIWMNNYTYTNSLCWNLSDKMLNFNKLCNKLVFQLLSLHLIVPVLWICHVHINVRTHFCVSLCLLPFTIVKVTTIQSFPTRKYRIGFRFYLLPCFVFLCRRTNLKQSTHLCVPIIYIYHAYITSIRRYCGYKLIHKVKLCTFNL